MVTSLPRYRMFVRGLQEKLATAVKVTRRGSFVTVTADIAETAEGTPLKYDEFKGELSNLVVMCGDREVTALNAELVRCVRADDALREHASLRVVFKGQVRS